MYVRDVQRLMTKVGLYKGDIDGDFGPKTQMSVFTFLTRNTSMLPAGWKRWGWNRRGIAAAQIALKQAGFDAGPVDGLNGPQTEYALSQWEHVNLHGKPPATWRPEDNLQPQASSGAWPHQSDMIRFYGQPGGPQCTAGKVNLPFPLVIAWNKRQTVNRFSCHEKVADSAERVFRKIASAYSPQDIARLGFNIFGGCYNYRKMRGGSKLSTHAFGIAIDFDPTRNQLRWGPDRAFLARPECEEFWRCWESEGWLSLGRARGIDFMHVQAARL